MIRHCLFLAATLALATPAAAETYRFDPSHLNLLWQADHFGFSHPSGKFTKVDGSLELDEKTPANSKLDVTVETASILTGIAKFDEHLKTADFLDVAKHPTATFKSSKVTLSGKDQAKVAGELTLLGVTRPVTLDVTLNKLGESPITKKKTAGFTASTTLKRSEFGMNKYLPGVGDAVKIMIEAEASPL